MAYKFQHKATENGVLCMVFLQDDRVLYYRVFSISRKPLCIHC